MGGKHRPSVRMSLYFPWNGEITFFHHLICSLWSIGNKECLWSLHSVFIFILNIIQTLFEGESRLYELHPFSSFRPHLNTSFSAHESFSFCRDINGYLRVLKWQILLGVWYLSKQASPNCFESYLATINVKLLSSVWFRLIFITRPSLAAGGDVLKVSGLFFFLWPLACSTLSWQYSHLEQLVFSLYPLHQKCFLYSNSLCFFSNRCTETEFLVKLKWMSSLC